MFLKAPNLIFEKARELRNHPTRAESVLWDYFGERPLGYKFRRQHPIADFVVDFYCHKLKLVIEADGGVHTDPEIAMKDDERQKHLESYGVTFLRFTNHEIETAFESVKGKIEYYITNHPAHLTLPVSNNGTQNMGKPL